ncbi:L-dopachrome tautomerase-related protein [Planosporangium sp. 12N6]|uniref:L-dopachrome tautomerase-related protein n=1 Tax=Planosporangium spinosum TaxID=3402278 RepID=UPI003CEC0F91
MAGLPTAVDVRLAPVLDADRVWNAVTTTRDERTFVGFPSADGPGVQVAEVTSDGGITPYPDESWNAVRDDHNPDGAYVRVNALRTGPDGRLWIVDAGAPGIGAPAVPGGARLIVVDLTADRVAQIHDLGPATRDTSYVDDLRFNGDTIYLTDAGAPGLIVFHPGTGTARRVLDGHPSTVDSRPLYADGKVLRGPAGNEARVHADQLEVSPDGQYLYYQPASGPLWRIGTRWLDDPEVPADTLAGQVELWLDTPTTGGTAIDAAGVIYLGDTNSRRILRISPDRHVQPLIADPRLIWPDAMWIDSDGFLWVPAAQLNHTPGFNGGKLAVDYPVWIYRTRIDTGPAPNDHP